MKKFIIPALILLAAPASADQLTFKFKSPSFSGVNQSSHYLTIENQESSRKEELKKKLEAELEELEREEENSTMNKFLRNFESRIYSRLSKELVESLFEGGAQDGVEGKFYFESEDYYIRYYTTTDDDGNVRLIMETFPGYKGEDGSYDQCNPDDLCTQIEVPIDSFDIYTPRDTTDSTDGDGG
tara:strand:- start:9684 stop:10235 length:552 start_codon:yes stop_codon:yes gene_type:complete